VKELALPPHPARVCWQRPPVSLDDVTVQSLEAGIRKALEVQRTSSEKNHGADFLQAFEIGTRRQPSLQGNARAAI
jgi:hypothetical protein